MLLGSSRTLHIQAKALACAALIVSFAGMAWAIDDSDKEAIRGLSNEAAADYNAGKFDSSLDKFSRAYAIAKVPRLAVWVARACERQGKLVCAYEHYRQAVRLEHNELWVGDAQQLAQKDAERELALLTPRLPKVTVLVEGAQPDEVEVKIDGMLVPSALLGVPRLVDPGTREIAGTLRGNVVRQTAVLAEGAQTAVVLKFDAMAKPPAVPAQGFVTTTNQPNSGSKGTETSAIDSQQNEASPQRTWGWVAVGIGAAGVLTGAVTGAYVAAKYSRLNNDCPDHVCDSKYQSRVSTFGTMRTLSTVGFVVGGVSAAAGITLLLTSPKAQGDAKTLAHLELRLQPNMATVGGTF